MGSDPRWYGKWHSHVRKWHSHVIQEQGNNYSWVDLIAFLLKSSNICLKNCFSDKFSLRAFIFPHAKFLKTRNLHLLWLKTNLCLILTTPWLPVYKRFLLQHIFVYDRQFIIIMLIHTCCLLLEKDPIWFLGTKVNLYLEFCIVSMNWNSAILCYTMMIPSLMLPMT